jgi:hypothetical protein
MLLRTGCALLLAALWSLPTSADEPSLELDSTIEIESGLESEVEFTTLEFAEDTKTEIDSSPELVDPMPEELMFLSFSSEVVEGEGIVDAEAGEEFTTLEFTVDDASLELVDPMPEELMYLTFSSEVVEGEGIVDDGAVVEEHYEHECVDFIDGQCVDADCFWMRARTLDDEVVADGEEIIMFSLSGNVEDDLSIQTFGGPVAPSVDQGTATIFDASLGLARESSAVTVESAATVAVQGQSAPLGETRTIEATAVTDADRDYASRLATIDEIRDRALTTGDVTLLERADRMEAELKAQTRAGFSLFGN